MKVLRLRFKIIFFVFIYILCVPLLLLWFGSLYLIYTSINEGQLCIESLNKKKTIAIFFENNFVYEFYLEVIVLTIYRHSFAVDLMCKQAIFQFQKCMLSKTTKDFIRGVIFVDIKFSFKETK